MIEAARDGCPGWLPNVPRKRQGNDPSDRVTSGHHHLKRTVGLVGTLSLALSGPRSLVLLQYNRGASYQHFYLESVTTPSITTQISRCKSQKAEAGRPGARDQPLSLASVSPQALEEATLAMRSVLMQAQWSSRGSMERACSCALRVRCTADPPRDLLCYLKGQY